MNSVRNLVLQINNLVVKFSLGEGMKVSSTMLSRLRTESADSPKKRNTLRSLAFWIGYARPELAASWHYPALLAACAGRNAPPPSGTARGAGGLFSA